MKESFISFSDLTCLGQLIVGVSRGRVGFNHRPFYARFKAEKMALRLAFIRVLRFICRTFIIHRLYSLASLTPYDPSVFK